MSIAPGQTRIRGEQIAERIEAHPPFAELKEAGVFMAHYNPSLNLKAGGLQAKLDQLANQRVGKIKGVLITVTPVSGTNIDPKASRVANTTSYQVSYWERVEHRAADTLLPHPADILDELQRVLAEMEFAYEEGGRRPRMEKLRVEAWEETADGTYLTYQIACSCLVPLQAKGA